VVPDISLKTSPAALLALVWACLLFCVLSPGVTVSAEDATAEALFQRGLMQFRQELYVSARLDFNELVNVHGDSEWAPAARMMLAKTFFRLGNYANATAVATELRTTDPDGPYAEWTQYLEASCSFKTDDAPRAAKLLAGLAASSENPDLKQRAIDTLRYVIAPAMNRTEFGTVILASGLSLDDLAMAGTASGNQQDSFDGVRTMRTWTPGSSIKIGLLAPLTGSYAEEGVELERGVRAALENYPAIDGFPVELIVEDTASDGFRAVLKARSLIDEGVLAIIGPVFGESTNLAALIADAAGIPFIAPTSPETGIRILGPRVFQINLTPAVQAEQLAAFAFERLGFRTASLIVSSDWWGNEVEQRFTDVFTNRGGRVLTSQTYEPMGTRYNFNDIMESIRASAPESFAPSDSLLVFDYGNAYPDTIIVLVDPEFRKERYKQVDTIDCILISADFREADTIASQISDYKIKTTLMGDTGWSGGLVNGLPTEPMEDAVLVSTVPVNADSLGSDYFRDDFPRRLRELRTITARKGYDATGVLVHCLMSGARTPGSLSAALASVHDFQGLTARISIDSGKHCNTAVDMVRIRDGAMIPAGATFTPAPGG
jgi:ABC-type branched-subunit amino acid transport system substrate-binding protein